MQDRVKFEYAIIRLVPKVEREEFFNVGVIVFSRTKKYLGVKYCVDENKFKCFTDVVCLKTVNDYLKAWTLVCEGAAEGGAIGKLDLPDRFRWLTASRSTIIQSSITHSGLCHNPEEVLEEIFESYIL
ncbi:DUF3037 domain-containing protein [Cellulophaga sp. HaHaR_3_176]|uniref:DUF3037 domain-containing protein n=1 Tax=Cellulophaga sp. HaHaR_3_176 TaxID=1942464 RepID=UPI001C1F4D41|nr:DUF3037 domain-containing protein [Cellulophaga sp. HaHaR_3_176]QWX85229.1 DUF3037 domain-containing protein [Cellulophaga sp. HaHaR_3_176]